MRRRQVVEQRPDLGAGLRLDGGGHALVVLTDEQPAGGEVLAQHRHGVLALVGTDSRVEQVHGLNARNAAVAVDRRHERTSPPSQEGVAPYPPAGLTIPRS